MFINNFPVIISIVAIFYVTVSASDENFNYYIPVNEELKSNQQQQHLQELMQNSNFNWNEPKLQADKINVKEELSKLNITYKYQKNWPDQSKKLGAVSAVSFDRDGNIVIFHRADRIWTDTTFNFLTNVFQERNKGPITENTVIAFDRNTGKIIYEWGKNLFYMPHGLTVDTNNNVWVTDVALHQVMKFGPKGFQDKPQMTLGTAFVPGKGNKLFCKPTSVAVLPGGEFFVADGYCNTRIMKFSKDGELLLSWGRNIFHGTPTETAPPNYFAVPHALTLLSDKNLVCTADRENGRVQCFDINNGTFHSQYHSPLIGDRLFSVDYAPIEGGQFFIVNGPDKRIYNEVRGFVVDFKTKRVLTKFGPNDMEFSNPHDIAVSPDGMEVYVVELDPNKVHKFLHNSKLNANQSLTEVAKTADILIRNMTTKDLLLEPITNSDKSHSGLTIFIVIGLATVFAVFAFGIALLVSRRRKRGKLYHLHPHHNSVYSNTSTAIGINGRSNDVEYRKLVSTNSECDEY